MQDIITNKSVWIGPSITHDNGWRKDERWLYNNGGQWGDNAIAGYTSYYSKSGTHWRAEISYYVEATRTENQPEVRDAFVVECKSEIYQRVNDDSEPFSEHIDYDYGDVRYFDTFEAAFEQAQRLSANNEAHIFNV